MKDISRERIISHLVETYRLKLDTLTNRQLKAHVVTGLRKPAEKDKASQPPAEFVRGAPEGIPGPAKPPVEGNAVILNLDGLGPLVIEV